MSSKLITTKGFYYNSLEDLGLMINLCLHFKKGKTDCFLITWE